MSKSRKKGAVYGIIAVMLCVAVYLNWSYVQTPDDLLSTSQTSTSSQTEQEGAEGETENAEQTANTVTTSDYV